MGGTKWAGQNRWVQIDRSKYTGQKDGFKKMGHTYRSKKTGPNRGVQFKTEMSPKLKCPKNRNFTITEISPKLKCHQN